MKSTILTIILCAVALQPGMGQAGNLDPSFGVNGTVTTNIGYSQNEGRSVLVLSDGKILVAATSTAPSSSDPDYIVVSRFHPDGTLDINFGDKGTVTAKGQMEGYNALTQQPDGKIIIGGKDGWFPFIKRYQSDGSVDQAFGENGISFINIDTSFYGSGTILALKVLPDGKILAGGEYNPFGQVLARFNSDGSIDNSFGTNGFIQNYDGNVTDIAYQQNEKIIAFGTVMTNDWQRNLICRRYHADGSVDQSFGSNGQIILDAYIGQEESIAKSLSILPDGKILMLGSGHIWPPTKYELVLWRTDSEGNPDATFGTNGVLIKNINGQNIFAEAMAVLPDNKILITGSYATDFLLCRLTAEGAFDGSFGWGGIMTVGFEEPPITFLTYESAKSIVVQSNGEIIVVGSANLGSDEYDTHIGMARFSDTGILDPAFGDGGKSAVNGLGGSYDEVIDMALQADGKILLTGASYNPIRGRHDLSLARYYPDGVLDESLANNGKTNAFFGPGFNFGKSIIQQPDGKLLVAGNSYYFQFVTRFLQEGVIDSTFGVDGITTTYLDNSLGFQIAGMALQTDGKIIVGGNRFIYPDSYFALFRYLPDGTPDSLFGTNGILTTLINQENSTCTAMAVQPDGKIILAGYYDHSVWQEDIAMVRYNADGSFDSSFGINGVVTQSSQGNNHDFVKDIALQPDGKILLAVNIIDNTDSVLWSVFRFNTDGSIDNSFSGNGWTAQYWETNGSLSEVNSISVQQNGKILLGGSTGDFALLRLEKDGSPDLNFGNQGNISLSFNAEDFRQDAVKDMILLDNGKLLVAGNAWNGLDQDFAIARYLLGLDVGTLDFNANTFDILLYPNPISNQATLTYELLQSENIGILLYNSEGKTVRTFLANEFKQAGTHKEMLDFSGIPSGSYFLTVQNGKKKYTIQLVVLHE